MDNQQIVCLITGANSGIGEATARKIASTGARVVMVCRDLQRGERARSHIIRASGNKDVHLRIADLSVQDDIIRLAKDIKSSFPNLNRLINNAGAMNIRHELTVDGIERTFAVNHMGYFILTNALIDLLQTNTPARIINVASSAAHAGKIHFDDLNGNVAYDRVVAYQQSKLANVLFTVELSKKLAGTGISVNSMKPGNIVTNLGGIGRKLKFTAKRILSPAKYDAMNVRSADEAGDDILFLALDDSLKGVTGHCFRGREFDEGADALYDADVSARLWQVSESLIKQQVSQQVSTV